MLEQDQKQIEQKKSTEIKKAGSSKTIRFLTHLGEPLGDEPYQVLIEPVMNELASMLDMNNPLEKILWERIAINYFRIVLLEFNFNKLIMKDSSESGIRKSETIDRMIKRRENQILRLIEAIELLKGKSIRLNIQHAFINISDKQQININSKKKGNNSA